MARTPFLLLMILYMYRDPGAVEEFIIVWCMLIAHIYKDLYLYFKRCILLCVIVELALLFAKIR